MGCMLAQEQVKEDTVGGGEGHDFFCASWDCVTSNDGDWRWTVTKIDSVKFTYVNKGIPHHQPMALYKTKACDRRDQDWVRVQFTEMGKNTEVCAR